MLCRMLSTNNILPFSHSLTFANIVPSHHFSALSEASCLRRCFSVSAFLPSGGNSSAHYPHLHQPYPVLQKGKPYADGAAEVGNASRVLLVVSFTNKARIYLKVGVFNLKIAWSFVMDQLQDIGLLWWNNFWTTYSDRLTAGKGLGMDQPHAAQHIH